MAGKEDDGKEVVRKMRKMDKRVKEKRNINWENGQRRGRRRKKTERKKGRKRKKQNLNKAE